jgi:phosphatidylserine/phosphatidylglycerophosphate/cardiolipin synthase-like enzyme
VVATAHHTLLIIDGEVVIDGSFNYTRAAQDTHAENVEITHDKGWRRRTRRTGGCMRNIQSRISGGV